MDMVDLVTAVGVVLVVIAALLNPLPRPGDE